MRGVVTRALMIFGAGCLSVASACESISTNPSAPFSFTVDTFPAPSIVVNDTMRDSAGTIQPITVEVFNIEGHQLMDVPLTFLPYHPAVLHFDSLHHAIAGPYGDSTPQFYIAIGTGSLQSAPQSIPIVFRPDSVVFADSDSIQTITGTLINSDVSNFNSLALNGILRHIPDTVNADSVTRSYLVRYQIVYPAVAAVGTGSASDTALPIYLVNSGGTPSIVDTTDANGLSSRTVLFHLDTLKMPGLHAGTTDSVVVQLSATYHRQPIAASPKQFVVHYTIAAPSS